MVRTRPNTRELLIQAMIRLVCEGGVEAATTRAIAAAAGITEGAIYRHYRSKEELRWAAYRQVVADMLQAKQHLAAMDAPLRQKLHEWIRLTFAYYDQHAQAFTYVLLTPPPSVAPADPITTQQGDLLSQLMAQARDAGEIRQITAQVARSHFTGLMLNIPRLINEGLLEGPALRYTDEVAYATWQTLAPMEREQPRAAT